jgi:hypothetical protein
VTTAIFFLVMSSESKIRKPAELINCRKSFNHSGYVSFHSAVQIGWARSSSLFGSSGNPVDHYVASHGDLVRALFRSQTVTVQSANDPVLGVSGPTGGFSRP